jgi:diguanylate cyclase (GGDEF)-like protein
VLPLVTAIVAVVVAIIVVAILVHLHRASDKLLERGLLEMRQQMDLLASELTRTVTKVNEDAARARIIESLGKTLDLDEVLARSAEAASSLPGVTGAVVRVELDGSSHSAAAGIDPAAAWAVGGPPDGSHIRAVGISYHYPRGIGRDADLRSAIAVPIESGDRQLGFVTVFGREEEPPVAEAEFRTLEAIASHAGPALENARRRMTVPRVVESDGLTGLPTRQLLHETLALEVERAHRHGRKLAVCVVDVDDFRLITTRMGQLASDGILATLAELLCEVLRPADLAYRSGGDEFTVLLPDGGRIDGEALYARLQASLRRSADSQISVVSLSAGIVELRPDDDGVSLYARAEQALDRAKAAGKGTAA